jgi:hypothetical protein
MPNKGKTDVYTSLTPYNGEAPLSSLNKVGSITIGNNKKLSETIGAWLNGNFADDLDGMRELFGNKIQQDQTDLQFSSRDSVYMAKVSHANTIIAKI